MSNDTELFSIVPPLMSCARVGPAAPPRWLRVVAAVCVPSCRWSHLATLAVFAAALAAPAAAAQAPVILWLSNPTLPGQTCLLNGAFLAADCAVSLTALANASATVDVPLLPNQTSSMSAAFTVPTTLPQDGFSVVLVCPGAPPSAPALLNTAQPWWVQVRARPLSARSSV